MYMGEMWFGIVEKPHPSLILGAYHFSLLFQPTVIPVKALEVMISATLKCFFFFFVVVCTLFFHILSANRACS